MPKPRGQQRKKFRVHYQESEEDPDIKIPAAWTKNSNHRNWLYLYHARKKQIENENKYVKTGDPIHLRRARVHNFKKKKLLYEGSNLYEETVPELGRIINEISLELFPDQEPIPKDTLQIGIEELLNPTIIGDTEQNPIDITQLDFTPINPEQEFQSNLTQKIDQIINPPKIDNIGSIPIEQLISPPFTEEQKQERLGRLQTLKQGVDEDYERLKPLLLALTQNYQNESTTDNSESIGKRKRSPVSTDSDS